MRVDVRGWIARDLYSGNIQQVDEDRLTVLNGLEFVESHEVKHGFRCAFHHLLIERHPHAREDHRTPRMIESAIQLPGGRCKCSNTVRFEWHPTYNGDEFILQHSNTL